ncbi:MAG: hypothetical protein WC549_00255 [Actinomycetota bacterium]
MPRYLFKINKKNYSVKRDRESFLHSLNLPANMVRIEANTKKKAVAIFEKIMAARKKQEMDNVLTSIGRSSETQTTGINGNDGVETTTTTLLKEENVIIGNENTIEAQ